MDWQVISKLCLLLDGYGSNEAIVMLNHLEHRMRTKQASAKLKGSSVFKHWRAWGTANTMGSMLQGLGTSQETIDAWEYASK